MAKQVFHAVVFIIWLLACIGVVVGAFMTVKKIRNCDFPAYWMIGMSACAVVMSFANLFL